MNTHEEKRLKDLLRAALPKTGQPATGAETPRRDLWLAVQARIADQAADQAAAQAEPKPVGMLTAVHWLDWALAAGLLLPALFFPRSLLVLLYYL